ncbi:ABC transporter permease [Aurantimonas sp. A3-2-R12]|uniref:ABC transporter permease n=1 Tax=Aurantimonas sp. A3-2-R12 TaxID=3114362 RepID=UPI002E176EA1|nr:ABC transporter permease [Aurantimonas sp. A3-2-R12]
MTFRSLLGVALAAAALCGLILPLAVTEAGARSILSEPLLAAFAVVAILIGLAFAGRGIRELGSHFSFVAVEWFSIVSDATVSGFVGLARTRWLAAAVLVVLAHFGLLVLLAQLERAGTPGSGFWFLAVAAWLSAWLLTQLLAELRAHTDLLQRLIDLAIPLLFGLWLLFLWEVTVRGLAVPSVLLPAPSDIGIRIANSLSILWADFAQTYLKAVVAGYVLGCGSGFLVAVLIDRSPFLKRGLLPIGNLVSALPIVGVAPIMVMWFGFDWPSKAAVVVIMTFFPMLVNTVAGLNAAGAMERDLMRTYGASSSQSLVKLRLPAALPFIFNALKINSTLALIGAIVAEFFGTPIVGMGFRISAEIGRMNTDMVWAEIAVAALAGSLTYGLLSVAERAATFWHPSYRKG